MKLWHRNVHVSFHCIHVLCVLQQLSQRWPIFPFDKRPMRILRIEQKKKLIHLERCLSRSHFINHSSLCFVEEEKGYLSFMSLSDSKANFVTVLPLRKSISFLRFPLFFCIFLQRQQAPFNFSIFFPATAELRKLPYVTRGHRRIMTFSTELIDLSSTAFFCPPIETKLKNRLDKTSWQCVVNWLWIVILGTIKRTKFYF